MPQSASYPPAPRCAISLKRAEIEAAKRLARSGYLAHRFISCTAQRGGLVLEGTLPSHYLKQLAQAIVAQVEPLFEVTNRIEVVITNGAPCARPETTGTP